MRVKGVEPPRPKALDPKSSASASSATPADFLKSREDRIRTCDPLVPNQVLYQAELLPVIGLKARPRGVEPLTSRSVVKRSIQLRYGRIFYKSDVWCRGPESLRYRNYLPQDLKSCASASSATPA